MVRFEISVISTNIGGIPEVLDYGNNGWLSSKANPIQLSKTIYNCINSPLERAIKSAQGRLFVESHFSHTKMIEKLISILSDVQKT